MKKIFFLLSLLMVCTVAVYSQPDTTQPAATGTDATTTVSTGAGQTTTTSNANALSHEDSVRRTADSLSLLNSYEYQKAHPEILYKKTRNLRFSAIIGFLIVLALGFYLFTSTNLCRDLSYDPKTNELRPLKERPYSYARVQLFWWTIIILGCYVTFFIYAPPVETILALNPTAVILLGGGLATSIFGRVMDNNQISRDNDNSEPDVPVRHQDIEPTKGLFLDIMSDEGGVTIHRFQAVIFNLVFGLAFITMFLTYAGDGKYPFADFEMWQLTLLGISAAGYLGLKANENGDGTLEKRQVEAVKKNDPVAAGVAVPPVVTKSNLETVESLESVEPPKRTTTAFEVMKAKLHAKGVMPH